MRRNGSTWQHNLRTKDWATERLRKLTSHIFSPWSGAKKKQIVLYPRKCTLNHRYDPWDWYIYPHLDRLYGKCRQIYHTWILGKRDVDRQSLSWSFTNLNVQVKLSVCENVYMYYIFRLRCVLYYSMLHPENPCVSRFSWHVWFILSQDLHHIPKPSAKLLPTNSFQSWCYWAINDHILGQQQKLQMSMVSCKKKRRRFLNHLQIHIILPLRWQSGKVDVGEGIVDWSLMILWLRTIIQSAVNIASILQIYIVQSYAFML